MNKSDPWYPVKGPDEPKRGRTTPAKNGIRGAREVTKPPGKRREAEPAFDQDPRQPSADPERPAGRLPAIVSPGRRWTGIQELEKNMADFVQKTTVKTAVRMLANPIADVAAFNTIVASVIADNPFGCVTYTASGVTHDPVEKSKENYVAKIVYQDALAKSIGTGSHKFGSIAGFNAGAAALLASAPIATAHGGTAVRDTGSETYSATLKCCDPNGEIYMVTFSRDRVNLTSYSDDAIRTRVETWADTVPALA